MSSVQAGHPLPAPPGGSDPRPRSKSGFSLRSDKSHKSSGSHPKIDLHETHAEKSAKRLSSKADPLVAMNEAEPSAIATGQASQLGSLRALQHRDAAGNLIAEPDRSNPTRSRWERPLDTIRSFEAAIDGNYSRKTMNRTDSSSSIGGQNRRNSYYAGSIVGGPKSPQESYYAGRSNSYRPDSYYDNGQGNGYNPSRARYPRTGPESVLNNGAATYGNQQYETGTNGSGSSGEPIGYFTDPSSENSSLDRMQGGPSIPEHGDGYGYNNYSQNAYGDQQGPGGAYQNGASPFPRGQTQARAPIKLGNGTGEPGPTVYEPPKPEKRKGWFGKRFSKG